MKRRYGSASQGDEVFYAYVDVLRGLTGIVENAHESIATTNGALGIEPMLV